MLGWTDNINNAIQRVDSTIFSDRLASAIGREPVSGIFPFRNKSAPANRTSVYIQEYSTVGYPLPLPPPLPIMENFTSR
jgi:hypothetical protein